MKKDEVRVGETYTAKVSGGVVPVLIKEEKWKGDKHTGWVGTNTATGRSVYIKSAMRLRRRVGGASAEQPARAAKLPVATTLPDEAACGAGGEGVVLAKAGSPRPPKAAKGGAKGKGAKAAKGAKAPTTAPKAKPTKRVSPAKREPRQRKEGAPMSGLDAAARVLAESGKPMRVSEIVEAAKAKGYWESKAGKTPEATVYAAIIREIRDKGAESRFEKKDRGLFAAAGKGR